MEEWKIARKDEDETMNVVGLERKEQGKGIPQSKQGATKKHSLFNAYLCI